MYDPITAVFGFLEKCVKPAADAATYFYRKRRQEKELIEVVWKDVIEALATRHLPHKFIENPGHFDIFDNETTQLKYGNHGKSQRSTPSMVHATGFPCSFWALYLET